MDTERYHTHKTVNNPPMFRAWVAQWFDWLKNMGDLTPQNHKVGRGKTLQLDHKTVFQRKSPMTTVWAKCALAEACREVVDKHTDIRILLHWQKDIRQEAKQHVIYTSSSSHWLTPFYNNSSSLRGTDFGLAILLCFSKNESNSKLPNAKPSVQSGGTLEIMT